jgi:hypothetical protein
MQSVTRDNFGLLIAYVLPGFVVLWGASFFSETLKRWLGTSPANSPTVGGFLYVTVAAVAAGLFVSTVRWLVIDPLHHATGVPSPKWNFGRIGDRLSAFELLVSGHYQFYQWQSNMVVAMAFTFFAYLFRPTANELPDIRVIAGFLAVEAVLWLGSRDALRKYYQRTSSLMTSEPEL